MRIYCANCAGDGIKGAMVVEGYVVEQRDGHWQLAGSLRDTGEDERRGPSLSLDQWVTAIESRRVKHIASLWDALGDEDQVIANSQ